MTDTNLIVLVGRITRDLDDRTFTTTKNGTACAKLSIAVNRSQKDTNGNWSDLASFFDVTLFGKSAQNLRPYLTKGTQIAVTGSLVQDRWEKDGQKQSKIYILADNIQLLGGKRDGASNGGMPAGVQKGVPQQTGFSPAAGFPEDIPF